MNNRLMNNNNHGRVLKKTVHQKNKLKEKTRYILKKLCGILFGYVGIQGQGYSCRPAARSRGRAQWGRLCWSGPPVVSYPYWVSSSKGFQHMVIREQ